MKNIIKLNLDKINFHPLTNKFDRAFLYLLFISLALRVIWLDKPLGSLIFDEKYYVNVVRIILKLPHDPDVYQNAPLGFDPNKEHPFLAKGIIALSTALLGDNAWGWRLPSVIFGALTIFIFYLLIKEISKKDFLALFSTFLLSFDNLIFVHSRIATLDIFMLFFMLFGFYLYFKNKIVLSALALSLSTLCKLGGLYGFLTIIIFHFIKEYKNKKLNWYNFASWLEKFTISYIVFGIALLTLMDRIWVGYSNPFEHMAYIYNYTKSLTRLVPEGIESYPWQWLLNQVEIPYLKVDVNVYSNETIIKTFTSIYFVGAMNPAIIYLCIPAIVYSAYSFYEKSEEITLFSVILFAATYLPFYPMSLILHRIMYIFYFLNTIPSVCIAISYLFLDQKPPWIIILIYSMAVVAGFAFLFPFKAIP
ncbi:glycosyltransferase family 39 protein [Candidatus Bathyarchaeota archaeon]|nr:glycosyltransferase family 39 protein [Candidatus Bathyarchaeota archaeon]